MAATSYDSLIPYIALEVDGAPAPLMTAAINLAARELCKKASCWTAWESIPLVANDNSYAITPVAGATERNIRYAGIDGKALTPTTEDNLYLNNAGVLTEVGIPRVFYMVGDMSLRVLPTPTATEAGKLLVVKTAFIPSLDATAIPAELIDRFSEILIAGAKFFLMITPNKAWSNPALAQIYKAQFDNAVTDARIEVESSYSGADMTVTKRGFGQ